jgi:hypothetical protein
VRVPTGHALYDHPGDTLWEWLRGQRNATVIKLNLMGFFDTVDKTW